MRRPFLFRNNEELPSLEASVGLLTDRHEGHDRILLALSTHDDLDLATTVVKPTHRYEKKNETKTAKVYQFRRVRAILLKDTTSGRFKSIEVPYSTTLGVADSSCAGNFKHLVDLQRDQPLWPSFRMQALLNFDLATSDSAASNLRYNCYETIALQHLSNHLRYLFRCRVHIASNVTGSVYKVVAPTISGTMALSLAMNPGRATHKYRERRSSICSTMAVWCLAHPRMPAILVLPTGRPFSISL